MNEDRAESKMSNASIINLLNEIEKDIDRYLFEFNKIEEKFVDVVNAETTKIKKQQRIQNREDTKAKELAA